MKVDVHLPIYNGADGFTVRSLLSLQQALLERGDEIRFDIECGGSMLPKMRNRMMKRFLASDGDVVLIIDADMVFDANDILAMLDSGAAVCGLSYTTRKPNGEFVTSFLDGEMDAFRHNGRIFVKVDKTGTGILMLRRSVIEKMAQAYADAVYDDDGPVIALFDFCLEDGHYYGEDYLFCKRWRELGGEVYVMADATVGHVGTYVYTGNLCQHLGGVA